MTSTIVALILSAIPALFIVIGTLWGMGRGAKKSAVRLIWLAITAVVLFFVSSVITSALLEIKLFNEVKDGVQIFTLVDYITYELSELAGASADTATIAKLAIALGNMLVNSVVFALLFLVAKYILYPIYAIVARIVCGKRVKVAKGEPKPKKHRILGGAIGAVTGLFVTVVVCSPIVGYVSLAQTIDNGTEVMDENDQGILTKELNAYYPIISEGYNNSLFGTMLRYTGMEYLSKTLFNSISSGKINGDNIRLSDEVNYLVNCYSDGYVVAKNINELQNYNQQQLTDYINKADNAINSLYESKLVMHAGDVVLPIAINYINEDELTEGQKDYMALFIRSAIDVVGESNMAQIKTSVSSVLNIVKKINERELLLPIIKNEIDSIEDVTTKIDKQFAEDIMDELFKSNLVYELAPSIANLALSYADEALELGYTSPDTITAEVAKENLTNLVVNAVDAICGIDTSEMMYYKPTHVQKIGVLMDTIKNSALITSDTYDNVVKMLEDNLLEQIDNLNIDSALLGDLKVAVDNLSEVTSWSTEFVAIQNAVIEIDGAISGADGKFTKDVQQYNFAKLGKAIDYLQAGTTLFGEDIEGKKYSQKLVSDALKWIQSEFMGDYATDLASTINQLQTNISNQTFTWENELGACEDLFKTISKLFDSSVSIFEQIKDEKNTFVVDMGKALDTAKTSNLFNNNTVKIFTKDILGIIETNVINSENPTDMDTTIKTCITDIKANIDASSDIGWEKEFSNLKSIFKNDFEDISLDNYTTFTNALDNIIASNSKLITYDVINTMLHQVISDNLTSYTEEKYQDVITTLKARILTINAYSATTYTAEVGYLKQLTDIITTRNIAEINIDSTELLVIGSEFDAIKSSYLLWDAGYKIVDAILDDYVADKQSDSDFEYNDVLSIVVSNFESLESGITLIDNFYYNLFGSLQQMNSEINELSNLNYNKDTISTTAITLEVKLTTLQNNPLTSRNGTIKIASIAMTKVKDVINDYVTEINNESGGYTNEELEEKLGYLNSASDYADDYITYLSTASGVQPYASDNEQIANGIRINKPFSYVADLIEQAKA